MPTHAWAHIYHTCLTSPQRLFRLKSATVWWWLWRDGRRDRVPQVEFSPVYLLELLIQGHFKCIYFNDHSARCTGCFPCSGGLQRHHQQYTIEAKQLRSQADNHKPEYGENLRVLCPLLWETSIKATRKRIPQRSHTRSWACTASN